MSLQVAPNTTNQLLWEQVYQELKRKIASGSYRAGDRFYSLAEITENHNVSLTTARKVLDELQQNGLIDKTQGKGCFVRHVPVPDSVKVICFNNRHLSDYLSSQPFSSRIMQGITESFLMKNCEMAEVSFEFLLQSDVRNLLLLTDSITPGEAKTLAKLSRERGHKVVCFSSSCPLPGINSYTQDYEAAFDLALNHLIELGHERIAYIGINRENPWGLIRMAAYYRQMALHMLPFNTSMVAESSNDAPEQHITAAEALLSADEAPTAIITGNYNRVLALLEVCKKRGLSIPDDLSIVTFDDVYETEHSTPPLTCIGFDNRQMGRDAGDLILQLAYEESEPQAFVYPPNLVLRQSTAPRKGK